MHGYCKRKVNHWSVWFSPKISEHLCLLKAKKDNKVKKQNIHTALIHTNSATFDWLLAPTKCTYNYYIHVNTRM